MGITATALKREVEARLAHRIPAALSPIPQSAPRLHAIGNPAIDRLLNGGFPLGSLCEVTGRDCSGRTSIALSLLASVSREAACAYIDVSDTFSPHSAAAVGVHLRNFLWVRFATEGQTSAEDTRPMDPPHIENSRERQQLNQQHCGGPHPRGETKGLAPALEQVLSLKEERRRRKLEGTPGYPNQPLSLAHASADQIAWEQFNIRKVDDRDPLRKLDKESAEAARQRSVAHAPIQPARHKQKRSWTLLDRALRSADQVLQAGGFKVVVFDIASLPAIQTQKIPAATWWRFQKAAKQSDCIFLVLSQSSCAHSSAACVLECATPEGVNTGALFSSAHFVTSVSRQRSGPVFGKKAPDRVSSWHVHPAWMRAVGR